MTPSQLTVVAFAVVTVGLLLLEGIARQRESWPTLGDVFTVLVSRNTGRFLIMLGWWWLVWHFFVR